MEIPCPPPLPHAKKPDIPAPRGACDAHFHIFGPQAKFPYSDARAYTPPEAPVEALLRMHDAIGISRGVVVQGNAHGADNSVVLDALTRHPGRLRGVAVVNDDIAPAELKRMRDTGVRGVRFHHMPRGKGYSARGFDAFRKLAPHLADLGLHVQFMMDASVIGDALPHLADWKLPVVLDHMGHLHAHEGVNQPGFQAMLKLLTEGRIWVKVSGAYRISVNYPDYPDARPFHEALVKANPDQLVWGTDWPHPRLLETMPDDGHLLDLFNTWTPDAAVRRKILVENPEKLYGFA